MAENPHLPPGYAAKVEALDDPMFVPLKDVPHRESDAMCRHCGVLVLDREAHRNYHRRQRSISAVVFPGVPYA